LNVADVIHVRGVLRIDGLGVNMLHIMLHIAGVMKACGALEVDGVQGIHRFTRGYGTLRVQSSLQVGDRFGL
jgi:hypothetical protein